MRPKIKLPLIKYIIVSGPTSEVTKVIASLVAVKQIAADKE
jgi:hypothetical protein